MHTFTAYTIFPEIIKRVKHDVSFVLENLKELYLTSPDRTIDDMYDREHL